MHHLQRRHSNKTEIYPERPCKHRLRLYAILYMHRLISGTCQMLSKLLHPSQVYITFTQAQHSYISAYIYSFTAADTLYRTSCSAGQQRHHPSAMLQYPLVSPSFYTSYIPQMIVIYAPVLQISQTLFCFFLFHRVTGLYVYIIHTNT